MVLKKNFFKKEIIAVIKQNILPSIVQYLIPFILPIILLMSITEMNTLDFRFKFRGEISGDPHILFIDIDDQSYSLRAPWNLAQLEKLLVPILKCNPAAIGMDLRFYGYPKNYEGNLQQFVNRIASYSVPIVLAVGLRDDQLLKPELHNIPPNVKFGSVTIIDNYYPDSDEVVRRVKLLTKIQEEKQIIPAFALQLLACSRNLTPIRCLTELAAIGFSKSPDDYHLIYYYNNYRHSQIKLKSEKFNAIQAKKIFESHSPGELKHFLDHYVQDSTIIIVGATYQTPGTYEDWFRTPLTWSKTVSGAVVHANILSWLLGQKHIIEPGFFCYLFLTSILIIITWVGTHFCKLKISLLIMAVIFIIYGIVALVFFIIWEIWLPLIWPLRFAIIFFLILSIKKSNFLTSI